jgi:hypothetical protein
MSIKYANLFFHCKTLQNFTQIGLLGLKKMYTIWQPWLKDVQRMSEEEKSVHIEFWTAVINPKQF